MEIIDISLPISPGMAVWPGDPLPRLDLVTTLPRDGVQTSRVRMSAHTGTHLDAPRHFIPGGRTIDQLDLGALLGACCVLEIAPEVRRVTHESLRPFTLPPRARVLLKTQNSHRPPAHAFSPDFVALDPSAATYLCEQGIRLVGIDGPSVDAWSASDFPCHRRLLAAGILILENLVLRHVAPGTYRLIALPLNLRGADGSPVRAILLPSTGSPDGAS